MAENLKKDITQIVDNYLCHSCGSCFASCGHDCISYSQDVAGFYFPKIDYDKCTDCTLCYEVCPGDHFNTKLLEKEIKEDPFIGNIKNAYVGKATDEIIYKNSQSGGVTTALVKYLLDEKLVSAAIVTVMNENTSQSQPKLIFNSEELLLSQKSKYVPTNLTSLIPDILKIEGKVAVVGLSCHMHGLDNLSNMKRKLKDKLIKIGLICDRVMLYSAIDYLSNKVTNKQIHKFVFRDTSTTNYPGDITFYEGENLHILDKKNRKNIKDYFTPTRCMLCFDKMNIYSDIVLGDPHAIDGVDKINGESLVIARTELGLEIINKALNNKSINLREVDKDKAYLGQGIDIKRKKFNANIKAWQSLGYKLPDYPQKIYDFVSEVNEDEILNAKEKIKHSINMNKYDSRDTLVEEAKRYFDRKNEKKSLFEKLKKIFKGKK